MRGTERVTGGAMGCRVYVWCRQIVGGFAGVALLALVSACNEGTTRPTEPSQDDLASSVALEAKGSKGGGGGGGEDKPALYDVVVTGAIELTAQLEISDSGRVVTFNGDSIPLKFQFSSATVDPGNCHWNQGYSWDDPEIVAARSNLTTFDGVAGGIDIVYYKKAGRGSIRRLGPWAMYCQEEDGTSGGCDTSETIEPDGTRRYEYMGAITDPPRWVRAHGARIDTHSTFFVICQDREPTPTVTVVATPVVP